MLKRWPTGLHHLAVPLQALRLFADCLSIYDFTSQDPALEIQDARLDGCVLHTWLLLQRHPFTPLSCMHDGCLFHKKGQDRIYGRETRQRIQDKSVWSCLLFCAVETKGLQTPTKSRRLSRRVQTATVGITLRPCSQTFLDDFIAICSERCL